MSVENIHEMEIEKLDHNPFQPRVEHPEEELKDLGRSVKENGMVEPVIARPHPTKPGHYQICAGERRVRACQLVGISTVPVIVRDLSDKEMALYVLIENLQRRNLNPIEQARGFKTLLEQSGWSQEKMAKEVGGGLTRDVIGQALRLLTFPHELQELVSHDTITPTHAEALARVADDASTFKDAISWVVKQKLTTKETEQFVGKLVKKQALRREILEYLTGENFLPFIEYLSTIALMDGEDVYCPFCSDDKVVYEESRNEGGLSQRMVCKKCGWFYGFGDDSLSHLVERIKELRGPRNQPRRLSQEPTASWSGPT
jgi:ParB family chromosome partitioning protein